MLVAIYDCFKAVVTHYIKLDSERQGKKIELCKSELFIYSLAKGNLMTMQAT